MMFHNNLTSCDRYLSDIPIMLSFYITSCDSVVLSSNTIINGFYIWNNVNVTNQITVLTSTINHLVVIDSLGCFALDSVYVQIDVCGCTDATAFNYNPSATSDDGSCIASVYGCMDSTAIFYDSTANVDDGSCLYCDLTIVNLPSSLSGSCNGYVAVQATSSIGITNYDLYNINIKSYL